MSLTNEKKKRVFRFQHQINDLENNRFEVLDHDDFFKELGDYLLQLYHLNHHEVAIRVIEKIGECTCSVNIIQRERALSILKGFAEHMKKEDREKFINILSPFSKQGKNESCSHPLFVRETLPR